MAVAGQYLGGVAATVRRDATIFLSYRLRIVSQVLGVLLSLATFYYIAKLVKPSAVGARDQYFAFAMIGILTTSILTSALTTAQMVRMELVAGNFERVLVSPMGPLWGVVAIAAFPVGYATLFASAMLGVSAAVFGISLHVAGLLPAFCVAVLGALALASIGLLFVASLLAFKVGDGGDVGDRGAEPARWRVFPDAAVPQLDSLDVRCAAIHTDGGSVASPARRYRRPRSRVARARQARRLHRGSGSGCARRAVARRPS